MNGAFALVASTDPWNAWGSRLFANQRFRARTRPYDFHIQVESISGRMTGMGLTVSHPRMVNHSSQAQSLRVKTFLPSLWTSARTIRPESVGWFLVCVTLRNLY